ARAGEEAALAAFRAARADPAPTMVRRPHRRRLTTGALAWIGALAATATAGAAFAAVSLDRAPDPVPVAPTSPSPTPTDVGTSTPGDQTAAPGRSVPGTPSAVATPSTTGAPSAGGASVGQLRGLCRAWQAKNPEQREKALDTPAYQRLVAAAGGAEEVEAYCQRLAPEAKPSRSAPEAKPSKSAKARPSHPETGRPTRE
ncbi:hypothetical protein DKT68_25805, partial [Micromonospora acroterricola]